MEGVQTKADQYDNSALIAYMHTSAFLPLCNNKHNYILHWELTEIWKALRQPELKQTLFLLAAIFNWFNLARLLNDRMYCTIL